MILHKQLILNTKPTTNGRNYSLEVLHSIADQINSNSMSVGRIGYDMDTSVVNLLKEISHQCSNAIVQDDSLYVDIFIDEQFPRGKDLLEKLGEVVFRTACMAEITPGTTQVGLPCKLIYVAAVPKADDALTL